MKPLRGLLLAAVLLAIPAAAFLTMSVNTGGGGGGEPRFTLEPWPIWDPDMRQAFDKVVKKRLYNSKCNCVTWVDYRGTVYKADWPLTDEDRRGITGSFGLTPFKDANTERTPI